MVILVLCCWLLSKKPYRLCCLHVNPWDCALSGVSMAEHLATYKGVVKYLSNCPLNAAGECGSELLECLLVSTLSIDSFSMQLPTWSAAPSLHLYWF